MHFAPSGCPALLILVVLAAGACAPGKYRTLVQAAIVEPAPDAYTPVLEAAAAKLGCKGPEGASSPICETAPPSDEEYTAFHAEAARLAAHPIPNCRLLGDAVTTSLPYVRMYRKALIKSMGSHRYYGVGHSYELDDIWQVRVARNLDDLNNRTLAELRRTLRHEVSHTIGAAEEPGSGWTAENYARNCA